MRALIFAAGRGERMRPLSDRIPKPLLAAGGRMLIEWQIAALVAAGIRELVINTAHQAGLIERTLGDGSRYNARIQYSREGEQADDALETLGGIVHALPLLGPAPFATVSGDIVTDFDYRSLHAPTEGIQAGRRDAHFILIDNPSYHRQGDMGLQGSDATMRAPWLTYANIAVFAPRAFAGQSAVRKRLFPWAFELVKQQRASAERFAGRWYNVGTPEELAVVDAELKRNPINRLSADE
ncbi:MAG TPA: nucleotidyltransferase family protein [Burkholderiaceae bacterium]|jgi:MurNAc alpha-1-phosphate uridylyltransferase|nr:nucleotidyltransferase family protein [Burkholderiaceae bacterium]